MSEILFSISTLHFQRLPAALDEWVAGTGITHWEGADLLFDDVDGNPAAAETLGERLREAGIRVPSYHLPLAVDDDLADFDVEARAATVGRMLASMERAAAVGAGVAILHPSTNRGDAHTIGVESMLDNLARSLDALLPSAERLGLSLALENMLPGKAGRRLGSEPGHLARMAERFTHPRVGFCLDTGHALVAGHERAAEFGDAMGDRIIAFHLADNAGDRDSHLAPGLGNVDWAEVFPRVDAFARSGGVPCIETPPFAFGPNYSYAAYRDLLQQTHSLRSAHLSAPAFAR